MADGVKAGMVNSRSRSVQSGWAAWARPSVVVAVLLVAYTGLKPLRAKTNPV